MAEAKRAARHAIARAVWIVGTEDLDDRAGRPLERPAPPAPAEDAPPAQVIDENDPERLRIVAVLAEQDGNVAAAARALGWHRNQLYRAMKRHGIVTR
jgi:transcriptional regulator with GAF, ATPase, and Fis domain